MILSIHQPNYLPYLGFFEKASKSDVFILYDSTQFKKNDWQNRNKICTKNGWQWISIPVIHNFGQKIYETKIDVNKRPLKSNWQTLKTIYGRAPYFKMYELDFERIYNSEYEFICDLSCDLIILISKTLGLKTKFLRSTMLGEVQTKSTQALIDLCRCVDADTYISGSEGINYIQIDLFKMANINLKFQKFNHPIYTQFNYKNFIPFMSIIDLIFNLGPKSLQILSSGQQY